MARAASRRRVLVANRVTRQGLVDSAQQTLQAEEVRTERAGTVDLHPGRRDARILHDASTSALATASAWRASIPWRAPAPTVPAGAAFSGLRRAAFA